MAGESNQNLRLLLLSKTSYDKRCTANTILCEDQFDVHQLTEKPQEETVHFTRYGLSISVVDTPGLLDSARNAYQRIDDYLRGDKEGFNAILLVFRYPTRMTPEEMQCVNEIRKLVGDNTLREYGCVVFTNGKSFMRLKDKRPRENFDEYIAHERLSQERDSFGFLLNLMPERYIFLDNDTNDEGFNDREMKYLTNMIYQKKERAIFYRPFIPQVTGTVYYILDVLSQMPFIHSLISKFKTWKSEEVPEVYVDESSYDHLDDFKRDIPGLKL